MQFEKPNIIIACLSRRVAEYQVRQAGVCSESNLLIYACGPCRLEGRRFALFVDLLDASPARSTVKLREVYKMRLIARLHRYEIVEIANLKLIHDTISRADRFPTLKSAS